MNFGFRLPGPFRIGVSDKGRVTGGVTLGPISVSGNLGGGGGGTRAARLPMTLDQAVEQARAEGFHVDWVRPGVGAGIHRGWHSGSITVVRGGVQVQRVTSNRVVAVWAVAIVAVLGACWLAAFA